MKKFGILAWPAYATRESNPYTYLIYRQVEARGYPVSEFAVDVKNIIASGFSSRYRIVHVHWPVNNVLAAESRLHATRRLLVFQAFVQLLKLLNRKLVWTVHNLQEHESRYPDLQRKLEAILYRQVDGFISLNQEGLTQIKGRAAHPDRQQFAYVPHPHYRKYYPNQVDRDQARRQLNIPPDQFVFLFLGQIRTYKNVAGLVKAFKSLDKSNACLLIAGSVHPEVADELKSAMQNAPNVHLHGAFVRNEDLQLYLNCADLVVTPYKQIFNSGSVFLNLSFGRPTLAPDVAALKELKSMLGPGWIKTYPDALSAAVLARTMEEVRSESGRPVQPDLERFNPAAIAGQTIAFYESLLAPKPLKNTPIPSEQRTTNN